MILWQVGNAPEKIFDQAVTVRANRFRVAERNGCWLMFLFYLEHSNCDSYTDVHNKVILFS